MFQILNIGIFCFESVIFSIYDGLLDIFIVYFVITKY